MHCAEPYLSSSLPSSSSSAATAAAAHPAARPSQQGPFGDKRRKTTTCEAANRPQSHPHSSQTLPNPHQTILFTDSVTHALVRFCSRRQEKETRPAPTNTVCATTRLPPCNRCGLWVVGCGSAGCWLLHLDGDELSLLKLNSWNSSRAQTHYRPPPDEIRYIHTHSYPCHTTR